MSTPFGSYLSSFSESYSVLLGYVSIACWLGAQFPQVIENYRRKSCEGLALPFLANWLLGDASNLVGCILTDQLPFQTWLATYFVFVDVSLVGQYIYYERNRPSKSFHGRRATALSIEPGSSATRYRSLSRAAANVATAAAIAAHPDGQGRWTARTPRRRSVDVALDGSDSHASHDSAGEGEDTFDPVLADSFHSEGGRMPSHRRRVSWSMERNLDKRGASVGRAMTSRTSIPSVFRLTSTDSLDNSDDDPGGRGRTLRREVDIIAEPSEPLHESGTRRKASRSVRRGATMMFLGVWALFGFGLFNKSNSFDSSPPHGRVGKPISEITFPRSQDLSTMEQISPLASITNLGHGEFPDSSQVVKLRRSVDLKESPDKDIVIGRIFAWLCTILYLTSRLPQIWKNFVRKSVEGLSMTLFVSAFLGNTFYVASIMTSPKVYLPPPISTDFIRESTPYLLGSGGTLIFDVTILTQSFLYRRRPRKSEVRQRLNEEEGRGLLTEQA